MQTPQHRCTLPQRIRAGCDRDATLKDYFRQLCHSAFVRVATVTSKQLPLRRSFATAHSCGLRRDIMSKQDELLTLPQRIRAGCDQRLNQRNICTLRLCHSAFVRVATTKFPVFCARYDSLPQRIRAGCDVQSAGKRVIQPPLPQRIRAGCDDCRALVHAQHVPFATAHSCGLRQIRQNIFCLLSALPQRIRAGCDQQVRRTKGGFKTFATAHSCGLRLRALLPAQRLQTLPQRIRAGCDHLRAGCMTTG